MFGDLYLACLVTVLLETAVFWLAGYRSRNEVIVVVCTNVITSLLLYLALSGMFFPVWGRTILLGELLVMTIETAIYTFAFGRFGKVLALTVAANLLSVFIGMVLFMGDGKEMISSDLSMFGFARDLL